MFGFIGFLAFMLLIFSFIYVSSNIRKLPCFDKVKNNYVKILLSILPLVLLFFITNFVNAVIIIIHIFIFTLIAQLLFYIIKKYNKKIAIKDYYRILLGVLITVIYLGIGYYLDHHVFETYYEVHTDKYTGGEKFRIVQISDSHIGATFDGEGFKKYMEKINKLDADIVVITGDYVDDNTSDEDMEKASEALSLLKPKYGVYYVYGNNDIGYTYREGHKEKLYNDLTNNNVRILEDEVVEINDYIYLMGRDDDTKNRSRKTIFELTEGLDNNKYIVDLNHKPSDYENEKNSIVDLVLSGHSHGGQLFPLGLVGRISGANDMTYGIKKINNTTFIVNSGISNWLVDFKTGTKSEYVIIDVIGK